ncbi:Myosin type-2 heavy chain 1 [Spiromyces aspiralis]|uniref:Myosin type-2 heavy chain 1 n=1 Tax=Spiromyces aspiralis TaxID=68401 RepID=A0ACC1HUK5_9FUNG|nr:Myosin type-2 heavy chain 1 [Spiromyces aspiralis]
MYQNDEACARGSYNLERFGVGAGTIHQLQAKQQQQIPALLSAQATNPREPTSRLIHNETKSAPDSPWEIVLHNEQEVCRMLECDRNLTTEILDEIIDKTQVPPLDLRISYSQPEMLFPAHLIGLCVIKMFQYNLTARIDRLLELVISRVQKRACAFWSDQETAFWLSNVFELLSIIKTSVSDHQMASEVYFESERAMSSGMQGLELLLSDIYFGWVKRLQKRMSGLIIPSIVEHQELYNYQDSDGILSRMMGSASKSSEVKLAHILAFLNSVREVMVFYYVDVAIMKQIISDLLCTVGATAFNNLIARRNFCSSNRGMQIQYNVSKIEEWCKLHEVSDKTQNLDRLLQLAKVLQMHKETPEDLEIIREVSDLLTPAQIKQILKSYKPADSEAPIPSSLIHHPMLSSSSSTGYLLNTGDMTDQVLFLTARKVPAIETFIPHHITARRIRALIDSQTQTPQEGEEEEYEPYYKDSLEDENFTLPPSEYHQNQVLNDRGLDFPRGTMVEPVLDTNTLAAMYERW